MLRMVIILSLFTHIVNAVNVDYVEPDKALLIEQKNNALQLLKQVDSYKKDDLLNELIAKSRNDMGTMNFEQKGQHFFNIPKNINREDMKNYLNSAFEGGVNINQEEIAPYTKKQPILLVSFSMPDKLLVSYLNEAKITGSIVAVRGLYKNDMMKTVKKIALLVDGDKNMGGMMVDPSLFQRFEIDTVPTFILPIDEIKQCTVSGCEKPRHVIAKGQMSIKYFLEKISLLGTDDEKSLANLWLKKYKNS
ncbi:MAG: type-F conjugative transfer system pilin assembly protein TrbC [Methylococcales bacterium]